MFADFTPQPWHAPAVSRAPAIAPGTFIIAAGLRASPAAAFRFLADIEALPRWAPELCERVDLEGGGWRALTALGEMTCTLAADDVAGAIDVSLDPGPGSPEIRLPIRVSAMPSSGSLVTLTLRRAPGQPPAPFDLLRSIVLEALRRLDERLGGEAPPARPPWINRRGRRAFALRRRGSTGRTE